MIEVIVFDLDDTLYLERNFVGSGFKSVDKWVEQTFGKNGFFERAWQLFEDGHRGRIFNLVLPDMGIEPEQKIIDEMIDRYRSHKPQISLEPDTVEVLDRTADLFKKALLTDGGLKTQKNKILALNLEPQMDLVVCTGQWGNEYWKPHQRGYETIQKHFGVRPESLVYVSDNPKKDFLVPKKMGWKTVRIRRTGGLYSNLDASPEEEAENTVRFLTEIDFNAL